MSDYKKRNIIYFIFHIIDDSELHNITIYSHYYSILNSIKKMYLIVQA